MHRPICQQTQIKQRIVQKLRPPYPLWIVGERGPTDKLTIAAYYRQWSLPKDININYNQTDRYKDATDICTNILKNTSNEFILIGDDNIDTLSDNNAYKNLNNNEIKEIRHNFMIENSLVSHHNKATFFRKGQASCLDHIYSNCHTRLKMSLSKRIHYQIIK